jgi:hypothetical protein
MFKTNWVAPPPSNCGKHEYKRVGENKWTLYVDKVAQKTVYTDVQILGYISHGAQFIEEPEWAKPALWPRLFRNRDVLIVNFQDNTGKCLVLSTLDVQRYDCFLLKPKEDISMLGYRELNNKERSDLLKLFTQ